MGAEMIETKRKQLLGALVVLVAIATGCQSAGRSHLDFREGSAEQPHLTRKQNPLQLDYSKLAVRRQVNVGSGVSGLGFTSDQSALLAADHMGAIRAWSVQSGKLQRDLPGIAALGVDNTVLLSHFSRDGMTAAQVTWENNLDKGVWISDVYIRDTKSGKRLQALHSETTGIIRGIAYSPDMKSVATADGKDKGFPIQFDKGHMFLWNLKTAEQTLGVEYKNGVESVAFSPDGKSLAFGTRDGIVHVIEIGSGAGTRELTNSHDDISSVVFSSDGRFLAAGTPAEINLWDLNTWTLRRTIAKPCEFVALSPNDRAVACVSWPGRPQRQEPTSELYDVMTGNLIATLNGYRPVFSAEGDMVATVGADRETVTIWGIGLPPDRGRDGASARTPKLFADEASMLIARDPRFKPPKSALLVLEYDGPEQVINVFCRECRRFQQFGYVLLAEGSTRGLRYILTDKGKAASPEWATRKGPCSRCSYWEVPLSQRRLGRIEVTDAPPGDGPTVVRFEWTREPIGTVGKELLQGGAAVANVGLAEMRHSDAGWKITHILNID